jgi:hypothetical protein
VRKYIDVEEFLKEQIKDFKCVPLVGTCDNDAVSLKEVIDEFPGIYLSDNINEAFTKKEFLKLLYSYWSVNSTDKDVELCAEYLETIFKTSINSVLPCNLGDKLYFPIQNHIEIYIVKEMNIKDDGVRIKCYNELRDVYMTLHESYIGETIFKTYDEAVSHQKNRVCCNDCGFGRERIDGKIHCCKDNNVYQPTNSCKYGTKA